MSQNRPTKLMVILDPKKVRPLQKIMGDDWKVVSVGSSLMGRRFDFVVINDQPLADVDLDKRNNWVNSCAKTTLSPKGQFIEVYDAPRS